MRQIPELKIIPYGGERKFSSQAFWGRRLAVFSFVLFAICIVMFRIGLFDFETVVTGLMIAAVGGLASLFLSVWAVYIIRQQHIDGLRSALIGLMVAVVVVSLPFPLIYNYISLPSLSDVSTDLQNPPIFASKDVQDKSADSELNTENQIDRQKQLQAYPDIRSMLLKHDGQDTFKIVRLAAESMDWNIISTEPPRSDGSPGRIVAVNQSSILGLKNQIVVRIVDNGNQSMVDVRSTSRSASHDLGKNAEQIRRLLSAVQVSDFEFVGKSQIANKSLNGGSTENNLNSEKRSDRTANMGSSGQTGREISENEGKNILTTGPKLSSNPNSVSAGSASDRTKDGNITAGTNQPADPEKYYDRVVQPNEQLPAIDPLQRQELYGNDMIGLKTEETDLNQNPDAETLDSFVPEDEIDDFGSATEQTINYKKTKKKVVKSYQGTSRDLMRLALPESTE